ncbi:MAG TPA: MFS transporter [Rhodopila sp.]|uniref:MFS transporter n=1 Tax=Rhodopila sp. TaxID=2480087 RepID=UPI002CBE6061|nr:MFS transporter [Rhodopila sp.]HVY18250.1 MFS transporter [Rhodopila sp.]
MSGDAAAPSSTTGSIVARLDRLPPSRYFLQLVALIAIGGWFEFYEFAMPGGISAGLTRDIFTAGRAGLLAWSSFASFLASFFFGMFVGAFIFSWVSDRFGRRATFTYSMLLYSVAIMLVAFSQSAVVIDILRFIAGFGISVQLINNDSFISEITPRHLRGRYMAFAMTIVLTSEPVAVFLSTLLVPHTVLGLAGWRWVVIFGALGGVFVWYVRRNLPESPRWLQAHGRVEEAERTIAMFEDRVRTELGRELPPVDPNHVEPARQRGRWSEMFGREYLSRTVMLSVFQFCQTIAVFGFLNWVPIILVKEGFTIVHSLFFTTVMLLCTPIGGLLGLFFAEKFERKWQLVGTAVGIGVFGLLFSQSRSVPMILLTGAALTLCANWLVAIFHPYAAELFPTRIRAQAVGFTFSWSRVSSMLVGYAVTLLLSWYGADGVFTMIALAMVAIVLSISVLGPRTNSLSLEALSR